MVTRVFGWGIAGLVVLATAGPVVVCVVDALLWPLVTVMIAVAVLRVVWFLTRR